LPWLRDFNLGYSSPGMGFADVNLAGKTMIFSGHSGGYEMYLQRKHGIDPEHLEKMKGHLPEWNLEVLVGKD